MPLSMKSCLFGILILAAHVTAATAQQAADPRPSPDAAPVAAPVPGGPVQGAEPAGKLVLLFDVGATTLNAQNQAILDQASRLYRDGQPIIMIVSGSTDSVGRPADNLLLSQRRANSVVRGMLARGIPAERTQILAKGETNPAVPTQRGVAEPQNRRVEITWR